MKVVEAGEKDLFDNLADEIKVTNGKVNHNPYLKVQLFQFTFHREMMPEFEEIIKMLHCLTSRH